MTLITGSTDLVSNEWPFTLMENCMHQYEINWAPPFFVPPNDNKIDDDNNNNKIQLTPKSVPPTGDEHAKQKN